MQSWIIRGTNGCENASTLNTAATVECEPLTLAAFVGPGTYWLVLRPTAANDLVACGDADYVATLADTSICGNFAPGDFDNSGRADLADVVPFVSVLLGSTDPLAVCLADMNNDSLADSRDIGLFVAAVLTPDPTGACCLDPIGADCTDLSQSACGILDGFYLGDGTSCAMTNCGGAPLEITTIFWSQNPVDNCPMSNIDTLVVGSGFQEGAWAKLVQPGHADILAISAFVQPGGTMIDNVAFNLAGAPTGIWRMLVYNLDNGFTMSTDTIEISACPP